MATELFQRDKIAYVFDSSATVSRSMATQARSELYSSYSALSTVAETYLPQVKKFSDVGEGLFKRNAVVKGLVLYQREDSGVYTELARLFKEGAGVKEFSADEERLQSLRKEAVLHGAHVNEASNSPGAMAVAFRLGELKDSHHQVVVALVQADDLVGIFEAKSLYRTLMVSRSQGVVMGTPAKSSNIEFAQLETHFSSGNPEGTAEITVTKGQFVLVSYAMIGLGDLAIMSSVDKNVALKAVDVLIAKSLLFFVALLAGTLLISIFASSKLTSALRDLFEATTKIANGDFNVQIKASSNDEVGGLALSFNAMAAEVSRLMSATAEKARMQSELQTVKTVQETLFPPAQAQFGPVKIAGHFEPASECGGDWWNYSRVGNKVLIWVGDATGHGAPAALITSAARSAAAVIESLEDVSPSRAMTIMNNAILQTSKGQIMMTFFIACIDYDKETITYANASHDPPYHMRRGASVDITKKDLVPLMEVNGPRLGDKKGHVYEETTLDFKPGDQLFFYTDGILDVQNESGGRWGERTFLKTLVQSANTKAETVAKVDLMRSEISKFRGNAELIDDVTMVMCEFEKGAA